MNKLLRRRLIKLPVHCERIITFTYLIYLLIERFVVYVVVVVVVGLFSFVRADDMNSTENSSGLGDTPEVEIRIEIPSKYYQYSNQLGCLVVES